MSNNDRLSQRLHQEAMREIRETVFSWGGKDVTDDGTDINITFPAMSQAFAWAAAMGVATDIEWFYGYSDPNGEVKTTITSFNEPVRIWLDGKQYAIKQFGRDAHRSYPFGELPVG